MGRGPSPDPTPLGAFGASIVAPTALPPRCFRRHHSRLRRSITRCLLVFGSLVTALYRGISAAINACINEVILHCVSERQSKE